MAVLSSTALEALLKKRVETLERLRLSLKTTATTELGEAVARIFQAASEQRVPIFATWYFAYPTTYTMLNEAVAAAALHKLQTGDTESTRHAVAERLSWLILSKYEHIVLRPEINDPELLGAFGSAALSAWQAFSAGLANADSSLRDGLLQAHQRDVASPPAARASLVLDWQSMSQKVRHAPHTVERLPLESTVLLSVGGAVIGKLAGGAVLKGTATALASKLSAPFVAKALAGGLGSVAGAAAGAIGGPGGVVLGAAIGVGVDAAANALWRMAHKAEFEGEVREVRPSVRARVRVRVREMRLRLCLCL